MLNIDNTKIFINILQKKILIYISQFLISWLMFGLFWINFCVKINFWGVEILVDTVAIAYAYVAIYFVYMKMMLWNQNGNNQ